MMSLNCLKNHPSESSGNGQTTLENRREKPPEDTLDHVVVGLFCFFNEIKSLCKAEYKIEEKCEIKKEPGDYCWPAKYIKQAWRETQKMDRKSSKRRHWSHVIMVQVLKSLYYANVAAEITPEQVPSEIPSTSKTRDKMVTTAKRNDDINTNTYTNQDCAKEQKMKTNPEGGSSQSNVELQTAEELKLIKMVPQKPGADISGYQLNSTKRSTSARPPSPSSEGENKNEPLNRLKSTKDASGAKKWNGEILLNTNSQTVYIRIPLSVMSGNESTCVQEKVQNVSPTYKLIDGVPNLTELRKKTSYAMLYDNRTRNAAWVYEILNRSTLKNRYEGRPKFKVDESIHPFFQASESDTEYDNKTYERGHLAAAANHRWCKKANEDTYFLSNMSPQVQALNRGPWKSLENRYRDKIKNQNEIRNIHVYSGPLYLPINDNSKTVTFRMVGDKAVPTHFFKVAIEEKHDDTVELECHVCPNGTLEDKDYRVSIEYIESVSGLIFTESRSNQRETDIMKKVIWKVKDEGYSAESNVKYRSMMTS